MRDARLIDALEVAPKDNDFGSQSQRTRVVDTQRQRANRAQVLEDLFAVDSVAARRAFNQAPVAIQHLDAGTVELRLETELRHGSRR